MKTHHHCLPILAILTLAAVSLMGCGADPEPGTTPTPDGTGDPTDTTDAGNQGDDPSPDGGGQAGTDSDEPPGDGDVAADAQPDQVGPIPTLIDVEEQPDQIMPTAAMDGLDPALASTFDRYTRLLAPNGKPIHLFAQDEVTDAQLVRARRILAFFLADVPDSAHGADKTVVANTMADNRATLAYFNNEAAAEAAFEGDLGEVEVFGQDLYATESPVEGSAAWVNNTTRDASFEEIFHLVHGAGIEPGLPEYQQQIRSATDNALAQGVFTPPAELLAEWKAEGSDEKEYIISVIDVYYGLWGHEDVPAFHGEYQPNKRLDLEGMDPLGLAAVEAFLPPYLTYLVDLDPSYSGEFAMELDPSKPYTHKSRYLLNIRLTGSKYTDILGNAQDNTFYSNPGENFFAGAGGNDTAVFQGEQFDYLMTFDEWDPEVLIIEDSVLLRDGTDRIRGVELLQFSDKTVTSGQEDKDPPEGGNDDDGGMMGGMMGG